MAENVELNTSDAKCPPPSFLPESLLNRIREELACVVCMDLAVRPSTLPCGHTACRKCLNAALSCQGGPAKQHHCPTCRTLLPVGMPALALNTTLKNLAELLLPDECKERGSGRVTPTEERRPLVFTQRVVLNTGGRAVSLHSTHEITAQANRSAVAGLNALIAVMAERWPESEAEAAAMNPSPRVVRAAAAEPASQPHPAPPPAAAAEAPSSQPRSARREPPRWNNAGALFSSLQQAGRVTPTHQQRAPAARRLEALASPAVAPSPQQGQQRGASPSPRQPLVGPQPLVSTATRQGALASPALRLRTARQAFAQGQGQAGGTLDGQMEAAAGAAEDPDAPEAALAVPAEQEEEEEVAVADALQEAPAVEAVQEGLQAEATLQVVGVPSDSEEAAAAVVPAPVVAAVAGDVDEAASPAVVAFEGSGGSTRTRRRIRRRSGEGAASARGRRTPVRTPTDGSGRPVWLW